ncbi:hypothetical protein UFOVP315_27 [uncultured Caudovirales phage]|uniref:Uncharacterized protein n=1 Tax=uncultured Caudovirales phage TaxID=2100421 RepID=A0A6J5LR38_9CAUD|nr:hypothetical protein UFOVP315_27 [uncultured Caudovirales phage]
MKNPPPFIYYCNDRWLSHLSQAQVGQWGAWNNAQHWNRPWTQRLAGAWLAFTGRGDVIINPYKGTDEQWRGSQKPIWTRPYVIILRIGAWLKQENKKA